MNLSAPIYSCTDRMGRIILLGMEEIIGRDEVFSVFTQAALTQVAEPDLPYKGGLDFSFQMLPQLQASLEKTYGISAGRGLAIRSGRACFRHLLREFGAEMGLTDLEFRLLSLPDRLKFSIRAMAALINQHTGLHAAFEMDDNCLYWTIERSPTNRANHNDKSVCHLIFGLLQETLSWTSGGKIYQMDEANCIERSDPCCKIRIRKNPIN
jgi:predicted hydrocarbon binding protein